MIKNIHIDLPKNAYEVKIGNQCLPNLLSNFLKPYQNENLVIITNETIHGLYPDYLQKIFLNNFSFSLLILPDGEKYKSYQTLNTIYNFLLEVNANRNTILLAFGGGVIGDITGFAAATFMRGISYIQIPTTLLSQVDSSIGGKTGINHQNSKNCIGAFWQPLTTLIDIHFLQTLPFREVQAGYAELIKYGFIQDPYLFKLLSNCSVSQLQSNESLLIESIARSCEVKAQIVKKDEQESGIRAILNFGHTIGHLIETYTNYEKYLHGEAIIAGMHFAAWFSMQEKLLAEKDYSQIHEHLKNLNFKITIPTITKEQFIKILLTDKKNRSNGLNFIAINSIGNAVLLEKVSVEHIWEIFSEYIKDPENLILINQC